MDGGYTKLGCFIDPMHERLFRDAVLWSEWMESVRKDVECTFGVIKSRFRWLWNMIFYHDPYVIECAMKTACILHNLILTYDGRSLNEWEDVDWELLDPTVEDEDDEVLEATTVDNDDNDDEAEENEPVVDLVEVNPPMVIQYTLSDYNELREALVTHFTQAFRRGMVGWPKRFQSWQKERFIIPPAERRARLQYHACLYHKPSTLLRNQQGRRVEIGDGLFSRLNYKKGETIIYFNGTTVSPDQYKQEKIAGRGGYAIKINEREYLNCYDQWKQNKCLASYANSPYKCVQKKEGYPLAIANSKLFINHRSKQVSLVCNIAKLEANLEILYSYNGYSTLL